MTWYEDVDKRLDIIENVLARLVRQAQAAPAGAPPGAPPARSVSTVAPIGDDGDDANLADEDLPPDPVPTGCTHQHQRLDHATKRIVCARCNLPLTEETGVLATSAVTQTGDVVSTVAAADLPEWAREAQSQ